MTKNFSNDRILNQFVSRMFPIVLEARHLALCTNLHYIRGTFPIVLKARHLSLCTNLN
jgi:hypothetical protein